MTLTGFSERDRTFVRFMQFQIFSAIYLQKIAFGPLSFQISVPMFVAVGGVFCMLLLRQVSFSPVRLGWYLLFVASAVLSQTLVGTGGKTPSFLMLILLYTSFTVVRQVPEAVYLHLLRKYVSYMILPACIVLFQYGFQKLTGLPDPLNMDHWVPDSLLIQRFNYDIPYPFGSVFTRPNGFFCLEPSFVSAFAATAAIIELTYFRRPRFLMLMIAATFMSMGSTGVTMLLVAAPFFLMRMPPRVVTIMLIAATVVVVAADLAGLPLPLVSRLDELNAAQSSGTGRLLLPASTLAELLQDPFYFFAGTGPGTTNDDLVGSPWPVLKLINEYGLVTAGFFMALYFCGMSGRHNVALKVALSLIYHVTGGYLMNTVMVQLLVVMFFIADPEESSARTGIDRGDAYCRPYVFSG